MAEFDIVFAAAANVSGLKGAEAYRTRRSDSR